MDNIDIDLDILEDMCSDLEESAFLVDKDMNIVWINLPLRTHILLYLESKNDPRTDIGIIEDADIIKRVCIELFGSSIFDESKKIFEGGRLSRRLAINNGSSIKILSLPIKYGTEVLYLLNVVDEKSPIISRETNTGYYEEYIRLLMNTIATPAVFLGLGNGLMVTNRNFDVLLRNSPMVKKFILENIQNKGFRRELKGLGYDVVYKDVNKENLKIASICIFSKHSRKFIGKMDSVNKKRAVKKIINRRRK